MWLVEIVAEVQNFHCTGKNYSSNIISIDKSKIKIEKSMIIGIYVAVTLHCMRCFSTKRKWFPSALNIFICSKDKWPKSWHQRHLPFKIPRKFAQVLHCIHWVWCEEKETKLRWPFLFLKSSEILLLILPDFWFMKWPKSL